MIPVTVPPRSARTTGDPAPDGSSRAPVTRTRPGDSDSEHPAITQLLWAGIGRCRVPRLGLACKLEPGLPQCHCQPVRVSTVTTSPDLPVCHWPGSPSVTGPWGKFHDRNHGASGANWSVSLNARPQAL